jgi:lysine-specific demethylase 8
VIVLDNVDRIQAPPRDVFYREYVLPRKPVIITDLFDAQPIRAINTLAAARRELGQLDLEVQPNYVKMLLQELVDFEKHHLPLIDYLDLLEADPTTPAVCTEYETPPALLRLMGYPDYCKLLDEQDVLPTMFVAGAGNFAHLHYDGDQRNVLMYQVFGVKRYAIIEPREAWKLDQLVDPRIQRTSALFLQNLSEADRLAFFRYVNAYDCLLYPGETLLMPMMAWHYVDYVDTSLSASYRLGRNRFNRMLAETVPITSPYLQHLAIKLADERDEEACAAIARRVSAVREAPYADEHARALALDRLCLTLNDELHPEAARAVYTLHDAEARRLLIRQDEAPAAATGSAPAREADVPAPPSWELANRPSLARDVRVLAGVGGADGPSDTLYLSRGETLEAEVVYDPAAPWVFDVLQCLGRERPTPTVGQLAARCGIEPAAVGGLLTQLYQRGWLA